ncbi:hypothetical protein CMV_005493 [Castanea mollissima]|uniref:LYR motif containing domain-containing protein n=1 Tax=Castanea mollissima TaxID=60419 RepID=A0A8J4RJR4_9ROSI|nr:hypothetical protein CMV_005493 [Castanea mollissima]
MYKYLKINLVVLNITVHVKRHSSFGNCNSEGEVEFEGATFRIFLSLRQMAKALIWATAEDVARNRGQVLSLYRQILRSINSPKLPLAFAARLAKKAEVKFPNTYNEYLVRGFSSISAVEAL